MEMSLIFVNNFPKILTGYSFFQTIPAHQSQRRYNVICKTFRTEMPQASSVTKDNVFTSFVSDEAGGISVRNVLQIYLRCDWCAGMVSKKFSYCVVLYQ